jgi:tetratricopeptide (TPR) repeat protein
VRSPFPVLAWTSPALFLLVGILAQATRAQEIPGPAGGDFGKAQAEIAAGRLEPARRLLESALKKAKGPAEGVLISGSLAQVWAGLGKYQEAKAFLAMRAEKGGPAYRVELARLILMSEPSGAAEAVGLLKDVVGREPKNKEAWLEYGRALARAGDYTEALRAFEMVTLHLDAKDLRAYHGQVEVFIFRSEFERARRVLWNVLRLNPDAAASYVWLGRTFERDRSQPGNYSRAIEAYENAYRLDHASANHLGHILFNLIVSDNHDLARSQARRLDKHPGDSVALWHEGLTKELTGDVSAAQALYGRAVATNPANVYARFALAHVYLGEPTPGFGPIRGARAEGWRYAPHRDLRKASTEVAAIKLIDPTFPFLSRLEAAVTESLASEYPVPGGSDEGTATRYKKMVEYYQHLQMTR